MRTSVDSLIRLLPVTARFLQITQTGQKDGRYWSIHELRLYGAGNPAPQ